MEVESGYAGGSKDVEQPATRKSADHAQQDVEQDASPLLFTILLPMNPAIRPRTIQARNDIVSPVCPVDKRSEEKDRP